MHCTVLATSRCNISGAHREGGSLKIALSTWLVDRHTPAGAPTLSQIREDLSSRIHDDSDLDEEELFSEAPFESQRHNNFNPLDTPLFNPSELPVTPLVSDNLFRPSSHSPPLTPHILFPTHPNQITRNFEIYIPPDASSPSSSPLSLLIQTPVDTPKMAAPFYMPARGEHAAPTFDTSKPRELIRFFEELEYLFMRASLEEESEKKKHILRY